MDETEPVPSSDSKDELLGELAVRQGYITSEQLAESRENRRTLQEGMGIELGLAQLLVSKKLLTEDQLQDLQNVVAVQTGEARLVAGYEVISKIGQGGMGAVYKAKKLDTGELVALKILLPSLATKDYVSRFQRESRVVQKLRHENIVGCVEFGRDERRGLHFCALEFVEGENLADRVDREGALPETEAVSITYQVTKALQHAYFNGLIHRDIKPENIMVTRDGTAKLLDLGLARPASQEATRLTQSGMFVGSPYYASPEQARTERDLDIRSDIYSLGATLYFMITGRPPFEGETALMVLQQHVYEKLRWPAEVNPDVSEGLCLVITKMMAKEPSDRYREPKELLRDLHGLGEGRVPEVDESVKSCSTIAPAGVVLKRRPRPPSRERLRRARDTRATRYPGRAAPRAGKSLWTPIALGAAAALAIVLGLVFALGGKKEEPPKPPPVRDRGHAAGVASRAPEAGRTGTSRQQAPPGRSVSPEARAPHPTNDTGLSVDRHSKVSPPSRVSPDGRRAPTAAAAAFREAEDYERSRPDDRAGAAQRYEAVAREFPGTIEAGKAKVNVVRLRALAARREKKPAAAAPAVGGGPWRPIFDGKTTDCMQPEKRKNWRVAGGALVNIPGRRCDVVTREEFADGEIRVRFELKELVDLGFNIRLTRRAYFGIGFWAPKPDTMEDRVHELLVTCRGDEVSAALNGLPVGVRPRGRSRQGCFQAYQKPKNERGYLRILSLEYRGLPAKASRPPDAIELGGHRYKLYEQKMTWHGAKRFCEERGGHLVTITSREEMDFVGALVGKAGADAWIGFTCECQHGKWEWVTGEKVTVVNWQRGEPTGNAREDAARMSPRWGLRWGDTLARMEYSFVCEWEPGAPAEAGIDLARGPPSPRLRRAMPSVASRPSQPKRLLRQSRPAKEGGLVGYWKLDEDEGQIARDSSGMGNHGARHDGSWTTGRIGGGFNCAGGGYVEMPNSASLEDVQEASYSISCWVKATSEPPEGLGVVVAKRGPHLGLHLGRFGFAILHWWQDGDKETSEVGSLFWAKAAVLSGTWFHVVGVLDATRGKTLIYVDGSLSAAKTWTRTDLPTKEYGDRLWRIGVGDPHGAKWVQPLGDAVVDEVRIYNRALSPGEVHALCEGPARAAAEPREAELLGKRLTEFESLVAKGEYARAREEAERRAAESESESVVETLKSAARVARALEDRRGAARRGAEAMVGEEVRLRLKTGSVSGELRGVTDERLLLVTTYVVNREKREKPVQLAWGALHPDQLDELAEKGGWPVCLSGTGRRVEPAERAVARACAAFASGDLDAAESAAGEAKGHPLAEYLKGRVTAARVEAAYRAAMDRARARMGLRNWEGAVESLEEALAAKPDDAEARKLLKEAESYIAPAPTLTLDLGGGASMELVYVKPGVFMMGGNEDSKHSWQGVEKPVHEVSITRGFYIGKYEVTRGQFAAFVKATAYRTEAEREGKSWGQRRDGSWGDVQGASWLNPVAFTQTDDHPVICVSWNDAKAFCDWAAKKTALRVRLPTEAEWEYACRAGSTAAYSFGDDMDALGTYAWHEANSATRTYPVGRKEPNAWGLHDMHGNVWEWVADWYDGGYYAKAPREDPAGPQTGRDRVLRSGGWNVSGHYCRSAIRALHRPSENYTPVGFRVACEAKRRPQRAPRRSVGRPGRAAPHAHRPVTGVRGSGSLPHAADAGWRSALLTPASHVSCGSVDADDFGRVEPAEIPTGRRCCKAEPRT